ncbi:MAG: TfoX/Sxy family protein [Pseudomonadota bacterium]
MAYDEDLAQAFRAKLDGMVGISEKRMMGGICFFLNGNMIGGADRTKSGEGRFMFRVGKDNDQIASQLPGGDAMFQGGRRMTGLYFVPEEAVTGDNLSDWFSLALSHAASLPEKT